MKQTKYSWLEAFRMMMEAPGECFMQFGEGCVYTISSNRLYVRVDNHWLESIESIANFNKRLWTKVSDPSEKWVKCTHYQLWDWALRQWAKGNLSAKYRSRDDSGEIRMDWTVGEIQCKDPTGAVLNGSLNYEYLDQ